MKNKFLAAIMAITALVFTACTKNNAQAPAVSAAAHSFAAEDYEGGSGDDYEALPPGFGYPYTAILDGDLSEFAGVWANGKGEKVRLRADGTFDNGETSRSFTRGVDDNDYWMMAANGTDYVWYNSTKGIIVFFPVGVVSGYGDILQTDITKDRMLLGHNGPKTSADIFYRDTSGSYAKILAGDLSDFAGTWVNGYGNISELQPDGNFDGGNVARDFKKTGAGVNEIYSWWVSKDGDGYEVRLYPAGIDIVAWDDQIMQTDTAKTRIAVYANSSDEVYYHERDLHHTAYERSGSAEVQGASHPVPVKISPGTFINGYIEQGEEHWFRVTITGSNFDFLIVETDGDTNTFLEAYTESYKFIDANYIKHDQNAWVGINIWSVKAGTTYLFKLRSDNSGSYRIIVTEAVALG